MRTSWLVVPGPYVHHVDPVIGTVFGVHLWWYGLSYALGFLVAHLYVMHRRAVLGLSARAVYALSLLLAIGVLVGGRVVEIAFYEWPFYRDHPALVFAFWIGGMATHGLLLGGLAGIWLFARRYGVPFLRLTDELVIPAAIIMGLGRIGNFIDGQIVGSVTTVPWAVKFPDAPGFRHPVVLYDGLKNLCIVPVLLYARARRLPTGVSTGLFLFLYAFLRIFVDLFREYPTTLAGLATGQVLNVAMAMTGVVLMVMRMRSAGPSRTAGARERSVPAAPGWRPIAFVAVLLFALTIPSDWTQDVPARYGKRHPGLRHSALYPQVPPAK